MYQEIPQQVQMILWILSIVFITFASFIIHQQYLVWRRKRRAGKNPNNLVNNPMKVRVVLPPEKYKFTDEYAKERLKERGNFNRSEFKPERHVWRKDEQK